VNKQTISDVDVDWLRGRTVVVRADLNVPLDDGRIADDQRIRASLPTIEALIGAGARVVLLSHLGRPKGVKDPAQSLGPVARRLQELLGHEVRFIPESDGDRAAPAVRELRDGEVALLENTRFLAGDTENDGRLAASWAALGDLFINDAFGTAHRAHASTAGLAEAMRAKGGDAVAGHLMALELRFLEEVLRAPDRPFVAIIGGAKISSKIGVLSALLPRVDRLLVGGAMANTFFRALGLETGTSLVEDDSLQVAWGLLENGGERLVLPVDCVVAAEPSEHAEARMVRRDEVSPGDMILDIGPRTRERYADMIGRSRSIVWNGPMGVFEVDQFAEGTLAIAKAVAEACDQGALGVLGGGDSAAAAERAGVAHRLTHVSTGGGASLELLAGAPLPGVDSLSSRRS
jgi:3-phosphoglycerate kinase